MEFMNPLAESINKRRRSAAVGAPSKAKALREPRARDEIAIETTCPTETNRCASDAGRGRHRYRAPTRVADYHSFVAI